MPGRDLQLLIDTALEAGDIAQNFWQADPKRWDKPDGMGPVTEADIAVNDLMQDRLMSSRPDWGWLSEESDDDGTRSDTEAVFVVDPIDGTRAFVDGHNTWAHSIAIVRNGMPVAGVVYLPIRKKLYAAEVDQPATLNKSAIAAAKTTVLHQSKVLAARSTFDATNWPGGIPDVQRHFRSSLAYRVCLVAEGRFDAMITLRDTWEWDVAAGTIIAQQAGATVIDRDGRTPHFNNPDPKGPGLIAAAQGLAQEIISARRTQSSPGAA